MGKKRDGTRKRRGAFARVVVGGVRTRSVTARRRKAVASAAVELSRQPLGNREADQTRTPRAVELYSGEEAMVGTGISSRSASTASWADAGARERTPSPRSSGATGAGEVCGVVCSCTQASDQDSNEDSSVVGDSGFHRERRETTPPGESSDEESSHAAEDKQERRHRGRISTASATAIIDTPARMRSVRIPPAAEIEEFLAAAERAEAQRFAAK
uniref:Cyclin-dependent kinase inhibitor n=1 Tax=Leersia perrieri TaxID=77586 RepID=A0A0D9WN77_9ORYZ